MMKKGNLGRRVTCEWATLHLDAYLDGELDARSAEKLRAHLDECPTCAAQAKEAGELLSLVAACDDVTPDPSVHESIMRALGSQKQAQPAPSRRPMWQRLGVPLVGACVLLALLLIPSTLLRPSEPMSPPAGEEPDAEEPSGKPSWPGDDEAEMPEDRPDSPGYDAPGCDAPDSPTSPVPPSEEPDIPPGSPPCGDNLDGTNGTEVEGVVYVLYRQTPAIESVNASLWEQLGGEWLGEKASLIVSIEDNIVQFSDEKEDIWAGAVLVENRLILNPDTDEMINFWVRLDGDTLWLTRVP